MILPSMGVVSELVTAFSKKTDLRLQVHRLFKRGHRRDFLPGLGSPHVCGGQSVYAGIVFSALSFAVAIPSAIKVFNWTATLYKGSVSYQAPMLYAIGFIGLFTMGGLTGLFLATLAVDVHVHATYFVVAHFHYIMVGGAVMGYMGGLHFWWPKITDACIRTDGQDWRRPSFLIGLT